MKIRIFVLTGLFFSFFSIKSQAAGGDVNSFSVPERYISLYGIYGLSVRSPESEKWNIKNLHRNTVDAYKIHYRHFILNNFTFFHHKNIISSIPLKEIIDINKEYGGLNIFSVPGESIRKTLNTSPHNRYFLNNYLRYKFKRIENFISDYQKTGLPVGWILRDMPKLKGTSAIIYKKIRKTFSSKKNVKFTTVKGEKILNSISDSRFVLPSACPVDNIEPDKNMRKDNNSCSLYLSRKLNSKFPVREYIIPVISTDGNFVSPEILRLQVFSAMANGFNAICFESGELSVPLWAEIMPHGTNKAYISQKTLFSFGLCDNFEYASRQFVSLAELGKQLLPVLWLLKYAEYKKSARTDNAGVWQLPDNQGYLIICYNNKKSSLKLFLPDLPYKSNETLYMLDLLNLSVRDITAKYCLSAVPAGKGRMFIITNIQDIVEKYKVEIRLAKFYYEAKKLKINIKRFEKSTQKEITEILNILSDAWEKAKERKLAQAENLLRKTYSEYVKILNKERNFSEINRLFRQADNILYKTNRVFKENFYNIVRGISLKNDSILFKVPLFVPEIKEITRNITIVTGRYYPLRMAFESGRQRDIKSFKLFVRDLRRVCNKINAATLYRNKNINIGMICPDNKYNKAIWDFIRFNFRNAERIILTSEGKFISPENIRVKLNKFDALWLNTPLPTEDNGNSLPDMLSKRGIVTLFEDYISGARGLLLTGSAPLILNDLRVAKKTPAILSWDSFYKLKDKLSCPDSIKYSMPYRSLGIYVDKQSYNHPIFRGFSSSPIFLMQEKYCGSHKACMWKFPKLPKDGYVLSWLTSTLNPPPDKLFFPLAEFKNRYGGKVIAFSMPGLDFSTAFFPSGQNIKNYLNLKKLTLNILRYLADKDSSFIFPEYTEAENSRLTINYADKKLNPAFKITANNKEKILNYPLSWRYDELPGVIDICFGSPIKIDMIHIATYGDKKKLMLPPSEFKLQITDKTGRLKDMEPSVSFYSPDENRGYYGITLRFVPIKTKNGFFIKIQKPCASHIRISGLNISRKYANFQSARLIISNIIVYGQKK